MSRAWLVPLVAVAAVAPSHARGAPCCGDQSGLGARLGRDEALAISFATAFAERIGGWNGVGDYAALDAENEERHVHFEQAIAVRAGARLELGLRVHQMIGQRALGDEREVGGGVGDPAAFARITLVPVDDTWAAPALFATLSARVPLGRPPWLGSGLRSDVTGQGAGELGLAVSADKTWAGRWFGAAAVGVGLFTPVEMRGVRGQRGPRFTIDGATGPVFSLDRVRTLACGVGVSYDGEVAPAIEGATRTDGRFKVALTAPFAVDLTSRWSLVGDLRCDLPASGAGAGDVAEVTATLGVRFGARTWDL